jgi:hypothetical protein
MDLPDCSWVEDDWDRAQLPGNRKAERPHYRKEEPPEGLMAGNESKCPVSGKRKYASEGEALATAAHQISSANAPKGLRAYFCSWCDAWHLTKNANEGGKGRR